MSALASPSWLISRRDESMAAIGKHLASFAENADENFCAVCGCEFSLYACSFPTEDIGRYMCSKCADGAGLDRRDWWKYPEWHRDRYGAPGVPKDQRGIPQHGCLCGVAIDIDNNEHVVTPDDRRKPSSRMG